MAKIGFLIAQLLLLVCQTHTLVLVQITQGVGGGATTRDTKVRRFEEHRIAIPREFYKMHKMVTIAADVMFINGILFLVTF